MEVINVIDLTNIYSCSFIATDDVGNIYANGSFEILGRIDNSDLRGCSLMVSMSTGSMLINIETESNVMNCFNSYCMARLSNACAI